MRCWKRSVIIGRPIRLPRTSPTGCAPSRPVRRSRVARPGVVGAPRLRRRGVCRHDYVASPSGHRFSSSGLAGAASARPTVLAENVCSTFSRCAVGPACLEVDATQSRRRLSVLRGILDSTERHLRRPRTLVFIRPGLPDHVSDRRCRERGIAVRANRRDLRSGRVVADCLLLQCRRKPSRSSSAPRATLHELSKSYCALAILGRSSMRVYFLGRSKEMVSSGGAISTRRISRRRGRRAMPLRLRQDDRLCHGTGWHEHVGHRPMSSVARAMRISMQPQLFRASDGASCRHPRPILRRSCWCGRRPCPRTSSGKFAGGKASRSLRE